MSFSPLIQDLINALRCLPGVGPKSAQRMALHLLQGDRSSATKLSEVISKSVQQVQYCSKCRTLSETNLCQICTNPNRNQQQLCIVESPADILSIEQTASFHGNYFVLRGLLSPIDGIGPEDLGVDQLKHCLAEGNTEEIILALNPTVEGQTTAHFISSVVKPYSIKLTRIAHGIPLGSELEYTDGNTLAHALIDRIAFSNGD